MSVEKECLYCGNSYFVIPCKANTSKYCSIECKWNYYGWGNKNDGNTKCDFCGNLFHIKPYQKQKFGKMGHFCSRNCLSLYKKSHYLGRNNPNCNFDLVQDNFFSKIDSLEKAYLLGIIASDGTIGKNHIGIFIHRKDIDLLESINEYLKWGLTITNLRETLVGITINSKTMMEDVCFWLGLDSYGKKSQSVCFPELDSYYKKVSFLRGLFDGDGYISNTKQKYLSCGVSTTSENILNGIMKINKNYVKVSRRKQDNRVQNLIWSGENALYMLKQIYNDCNCNIELQRKKNLYNYWLNNHILTDRYAIKNAKFNSLEK